VSEHLDLADWRRQISGLYGAARAAVDDQPGALTAFRAAKDSLFASHPQSPIPASDRESFTGLEYWPADPRLRFEARVEHDPAPTDPLPVSTGDAPGAVRIGWVSLNLADGPVRLAVFGLTGYGGGLFLPFRDATSGEETYGGGRYLLDTVKGADLGGSGQTLVVDFNYAYHPSCAYDPQWSCPLAPTANWLSIPIRAGERLHPGAH
jgi:hypothetical protein